MSLAFHWFLPTYGDSRNLVAGGHGTAMSGDRPATLRYLRQIGAAAEDNGFEAVLTPTGLWCEDAWLTTAMLVETTETLKFLVAIRPGLLSPTLAAQMAGTYQRHSNGRLLLNVVTGGEPHEQRAYGDFLDKEARYARTAEFLHVVRQLWTSAEPVTFAGQHIRVEGAQLNTPPDPVPPVFFGGSSAAAGPVAAKHSDVYLTWGEPVQAVADKLDWIRGLAVDRGRILQYGLRIHVISRDTSEQAWAEADRLLAAVDPADVRRVQASLARSESEGQRRMQDLHGGDSGRLLVGPNLWAGVGLVRGGAGTALVGSHAEVAERLAEYAKLGITHFILSGYPHLEEAYWFGEGVLPLLQRMGLWRHPSRTSRPGPATPLAVAAAHRPAMATTLPDAALAASAGHAESDTARRRRLRVVVAASLLGTTVEWYDFFLYATAAGLVFNKVFFPGESSLVGTLLAFATFAVGFVMRPVGGLVFGHIGDRIGRKRSLALTMLIMGVATALIGVLPTAARIGVWAPLLLLALRILQGFALGGEWAGAVLLAVEHSPPGRRGRFGAIPQVGLALGLALGTGIFALLQIALGPAHFLAYGWRVGFLLRLLLVVIGVVVRLRVEETPAFRELRDLAATATVPIRDIVREPRSRRNTLLGLLSRWAEGSAFNTWGVFAISYATGALGFDRVSVLVVVTIAALLMAVLLPVSGALTDRFGARRVYLAGVACYGIAAFPAFALFGTKNLVWFGVALIVVFGVVHALFYGAQGTLYSSLYPTGTRYTGLSFVYQVSGIYASGVTPMIVTALIAALGGAPWLACGYLVATAAISVLATALIREQDLHL